MLPWVESLAPEAAHERRRLLHDLRPTVGEVRAFALFHGWISLGSQFSFLEPMAGRRDTSGEFGRSNDSLTVEAPACIARITATGA